MRNRYIAPSLALAALMFLFACSKSDTPQSPEKTPGPARAVDPASAATVSGTVQFTGPVPKLVKIDMSADPACRGDNGSEQIVAKGGKLANVFVYVKEGAGGGWTLGPRDVVVRQEGCRYVPHVVGVMAGQTVRFENLDDAMHNIHPMPRNNQEWNTAQSPHGEPLVRRFQNPELMIPVKCNQHPWMRMYVNVTSNPFFAVTGPDGAFELNGLPPGTYTIAAVHESLGQQEQKVTLGPKQTLNTHFTFGEKGAAGAK